MPEGDNTDRIERRAAVRRKIHCINDLQTLEQLVPEKDQSIVQEVKRIFEEVPADAERPTEADRKALLERAKELNEEFRKKKNLGDINKLKEEEAAQEAAQGAAAGESSPCPKDPELSPQKIAEFNTKMMGPEGVDELSAMLIERIVEEQTRRKEEADRRDAAAAGNGALAEGGSRKRKRSKKRKGKGNKTRKNAKNNNNNNTTRRRKKTARRRRTKRA